MSKEITTQKQVIIDCFPESAHKYRNGYAVVAVDVIRATTSAITVAARGGRCLPVPSVDAAFRLKCKLRDPLLAGEIAGAVAPGFELNNSPAELAVRDITGRPVILLSSSGTRLISQAMECDIVHLACFRNYGFVARHIAGLVPRVAVIGAGSRGEFREEDQMCCAWIARDLAEMGYAPAAESADGDVLIARTSAQAAAADAKSQTLAPPAPTHGRTPRHPPPRTPPPPRHRPRSVSLPGAFGRRIGKGTLVLPMARVKCSPSGIVAAVLAGSPSSPPTGPRPAPGQLGTGRATGSRPSSWWRVAPRRRHRCHPTSRASSLASLPGSRRGSAAFPCSWAEGCPTACSTASSGSPPA